MTMTLASRLILAFCALLLPVAAQAQPVTAIVGADFVEGRGGRVVRVALVPDQSTTRLVERLRGPS